MEGIYLLLVQVKGFISEEEEEDTSNLDFEEIRTIRWAFFFFFCLELRFAGQERNLIWTLIYNLHQQIQNCPRDENTKPGNQATSAMKMQVINTSIGIHYS